jgi:hypothetical protein
MTGDFNPNPGGSARGLLPLVMVQFVIARSSAGQQSDEAIQPFDKLIAAP